MNKTQINSLLEAHFQGVRRDGLEALAGVLAIQGVESQEELEGIIGKMKAEEVTAFVKDYRSTIDKEVTKAVDTYRAKHEQAQQKEKEATPKEQAKTDDKEQTPDWTKAIEEALKPLREELAQYKEQDKSRGRLAKVEAHLKECKDEFVRSRMLKDYQRANFQSEEEFEAYLGELHEDVQTANQRLTNDGLNVLPKPKNGGEAKGVSEAVKQILNNKNAEDVGGKDL